MLSWNALDKKNSDHPHFTDENTEAQGMLLFAQVLVARKYGKIRTNAKFLVPIALFFSFLVIASQYASH